MSFITNLISPEKVEIPKFLPKLRLGIMASGKGSNFEALVKSTKSNLDAEIKCLIVNNVNSAAISIAKEHNIPFKIVNHKSYKNREELDLEIINIYSQYKIELIVMAGWMRIVTPVLINEYPQRIINIHPSLLPSFKGSEAIREALEKKVSITGCTAHLVEKEVDSGEILIQAALAINKDDDILSLKNKIQSLEHQILYKGVAIAGIRLRNKFQGK